MLVGSALDGDLDEIWEEVEWQLSANPYLKDALRASTTKPYRRLTWRNGLRVLFRPAGHDGRAYRGIHVRGWLLHDEAAKVVNPRSWAEFWRAAKGRQLSDAELESLGQTLYGLADITVASFLAKKDRAAVLPGKERSG